MDATLSDEQRGGRTKPRKARRTTIRDGKFLKLLHLSFGMSPDVASGNLVYTGRIGLGVQPVHDEIRATERTTEGAVTAIDLALRAAIAKMRQDVPEVQLWPYHIRLTSRSRGVSSPVVAQARIALNGWQATRRVRHQDGVTAAAFLLFDAYDHILYERWRACIDRAGVSPQDAFRAMASADRGDRGGT